MSKPLYRFDGQTFFKIEKTGERDGTKYWEYEGDEGECIWVSESGKLLKD